MSNNGKVSGNKVRNIQKQMMDERQSEFDSFREGLLWDEMYARKNKAAYDRMFYFIECTKIQGEYDALVKKRQEEYDEQIKKQKALQEALDNSGVQLSGEAGAEVPEVNEENGLTDVGPTIITETEAFAGNVDEFIKEHAVPQEETGALAD